MKQRNMYFNPLSALVWWYDLAILVLMAPSNSVVVFFRNKLGYRLIQPWIFQLTFLALMFVSQTSTLGAALSNGSASPVTPISIFAVLMAILAFYHRKIGWKLIFDTANPGHTMSRGDSYLAKVLPIREDLIQRFAEPLLCMGAGWFFMGISWPLGLWLFIAGVSLGLIEGLVLENAMNKFLDLHDAGVEARIHKEIQDAIKNGGPMPTGKRGNIPVYPSPELQQLRSQRLMAPEILPLEAPEPPVLPAPQVTATNGIAPVSRITSASEEEVVTLNGNRR